MSTNRLSNAVVSQMWGTAAVIFAVAAGVAMGCEGSGVTTPAAAVNSAYRFTTTVVDPQGSAVPVTVSGLPNGPLTFTTCTVSLNLPDTVTPYSITLASPGMEPVCLQVTASTSKCGVVTLRPAATITITGTAIDAADDQPVAVEVTVPGADRSPFYFCDGVINIPCVSQPQAGSPLQVTVQALSDTENFAPVQVSVSDAASASLGQVSVQGATVPAGTAAANSSVLCKYL